METKPLLYGLIGFLIGGLLVSVAATTFDKPQVDRGNYSHSSSSSEMSMDDMTSDLKSKTGDDFDKAFVSEMIIHHQGAIDMANLALDNAKHQEVKDLAKNIIDAQTSEISQMKDWQTKWGYSSNTMMDGHNMMGM